MEQPRHQSARDPTDGIDLYSEQLAKGVLGDDARSPVCAAFPDVYDRLGG